MARVGEWVVGGTRHSLLATTILKSGLSCTSSGWDWGMRGCLTMPYGYPANINLAEDSLTSCRGRRYDPMPAIGDSERRARNENTPWRQGPRGAFRWVVRQTLGEGGDVGGLLTLRPIHDVELNRLPLVEASEASPLDRGIVHEDIGAVRPLDEAVPLAVVEPLYGPASTHPSLPPFV